MQELVNKSVVAAAISRPKCRNRSLRMLMGLNISEIFVFIVLNCWVCGIGLTTQAQRQAERARHLFAAAHVHMFFQGGLPLHNGGSKEIPPSRLSFHSSLDPSRKSRMCMPKRHPFQVGYFLTNIKGEPRAAAHWLQHLVRRIPL